MAAPVLEIMDIMDIMDIHSFFSSYFVHRTFKEYCYFDVE
jgi:hypothetical protein